MKVFPHCTNGMTYTLQINFDLMCGNVPKVIKVVLLDGFQSHRWLVHSVQVSNVEKGVLNGWPHYDKDLLFESSIKL